MMMIIIIMIINFKIIHGDELNWIYLAPSNNFQGEVTFAIWQRALFHCELGIVQINLIVWMVYRHE